MELFQESFAEKAELHIVCISAIERKKEVVR
jgi:hypothetical protein